MEGNGMKRNFQEYALCIMVDAGFSNRAAYKISMMLERNAYKTVLFYLMGKGGSSFAQSQTGWIDE